MDVESKAVVEVGRRGRGGGGGGGGEVGVMGMGMEEQGSGYNRERERGRYGGWEKRNGGKWKDKEGKGRTHNHAYPHFLPSSFFFHRFVKHDVQEDL